MLADFYHYASIDNLDSEERLQPLSYWMGNVTAHFDYLSLTLTRMLPYNFNCHLIQAQTVLVFEVRVSICVEISNKQNKTKHCGRQSFDVLIAGQI